MSLQIAKPAPPNDDKRWKMVEVTMRRSGYASHALIETLHRVQGLFGYLDEPAMTFVAESLGVPLSKVYGVATFYHLFSLKPQGRHTCVICTGHGLLHQGGRGAGGRGAGASTAWSRGTLRRIANCRWWGRGALVRAAWRRLPWWTGKSWAI